MYSNLTLRAPGEGSKGGGSEGGREGLELKVQQCAGCSGISYLPDFMEQMFK